MRAPPLGLILLFVIGCLGTHALPPEPSIASSNAKRTIALHEYTTRGSWERTGFFRVDQDVLITLPVRLAIAADGTGCVIEDDVATVWRYDRVIGCATPWRIARGRA